MDYFIVDLINMFQAYSTEFVSLLTLLACFAAILMSYRLWGLHGLYVYNTVAFIVANIQVLRLVTYSFSPQPAAMGTVVFCTTFLVSDIIVEHFGTKAANRGVWLSFYAQILASILMLLAVGHAPVVPEGIQDVGLDTQEAMMQLFVPSPRLFIASLAAYAASQLFDIWLFQKIRLWCHNKWVWLRQNVSTALSGILDNMVFSWLAWVVFSPTPLSYETMFYTFVVWSYVIRLIVSFLSTPVLYATYRWKPRQNL
jgi:uncharacterized integral membrane protein (TIGR00697 family)